MQDKPINKLLFLNFREVKKLGQGNSTGKRKEKRETDGDGLRIDSLRRIIVSQSHNPLQGTGCLNTIDDKIESNRTAAILKTQTIGKSFHQEQASASTLLGWDGAITRIVKPLPLVGDGKIHTALAEITFNCYILADNTVVAVYNSIFDSLEQRHRDSTGIIVDVISITNGTYKTFNLYQIVNIRLYNKLFHRKIQILSQLQRYIIFLKHQTYFKKFHKLLNSYYVEAARVKRRKCR